MQTEIMLALQGSLKKRLFCKKSVKADRYDSDDVGNKSECCCSWNFKT